VQEIGSIIASGGRYDNLIEKFGFDCPAVGFSININLILSVL
jgi:ATP phosphoribosyltransferase regulatory subunit